MGRAVCFTLVSSIFLYFCLWEKNSRWQNHIKKPGMKLYSSTQQDFPTLTQSSGENRSWWNVQAQLGKKRDENLGGGGVGGVKKKVSASSFSSHSDIGSHLMQTTVRSVSLKGHGKLLRASSPEYLTWDLYNFPSVSRLHMGGPLCLHPVSKVGLFWHWKWPLWETKLQGLGWRPHHGF